jgi:hypothetical protein
MEITDMKINSMIDYIEKLAGEKNYAAMDLSTCSEGHFFYRLRSSFGDCESALSAQFVKQIEKLSNFFDPNNSPPDDKILKSILKLMAAFKFLSNPTVFCLKSS